MLLTLGVKNGIPKLQKVLPPVKFIWLIIKHIFCETIKILFNADYFRQHRW